MRPRSRDAVSGVLVQTGRSTRSTAAVSTSATGSAPMIGKACLARVARHCQRCFSFRHSAARASSSASAAAWKVRSRDAASAASWAFRRRSRTGSLPSFTSARAAAAASRAAFSDTWGKPPSDMSRWLPWRR